MKKIFHVLWITTQPFSVTENDQIKSYILKKNTLYYLLTALFF